MKMIVLPYPQAFTDTPTRNEHVFYQVSHAVSQLDFVPERKIIALALFESFILCFLYCNYFRTVIFWTPFSLKSRSSVPFRNNSMLKVFIEIRRSRISLPTARRVGIRAKSFVFYFTGNTEYL